MFRSVCVGNKLCFDNDLQRAWLIHESKVKNQRCLVDIGRKSFYSLPKGFSKKEALHEQHLDNIDKENEQLLKRIDSIYNRKIKSPSKQCRESQAGSLHWPFRQRQQQMIAEENDKMRKRLMSQKSKLTQDSFFNESLRKITSPPKKQKRVFNFQRVNDETKYNCSLRACIEKRAAGRKYCMTSERFRRSVRIKAEDVQTGQTFMVKLPIVVAQNLIKQHFSGDINKLLETITINRYRRQIELPLASF